MYIDNWIVNTLENTLTTWNEKLSEVWSLLSQSPQSFKGGDIWNLMVSISNGLQGVGYTAFQTEKL